MADIVVQAAFATHEMSHISSKACQSNHVERPNHTSCTSDQIQCADSSQMGHCITYSTQTCARWYVLRLPRRHGRLHQLWIRYIVFRTTPVAEKKKYQWYRSRFRTSGLPRELGTVVARSMRCPVNISQVWSQISAWCHPYRRWVTWLLFS